MVEPEFLLDTNICIYLLEGKSEIAANRFTNCFVGQIVTSAIVYAEVIFGAQRFDAVGQARAFFTNIPILPFDQEVAEVYSRLSFKRGSYDRLIGAQALSLDLTLVTNNEADFGDIPELNVENWTVAA
ncbi:type II toxin-antitoxin system VapC family toxin [Parasphingorhabdus halotolerans]|uniref:Type II toxin-antitoxin system VapC family toxin n=1 Tax=Parasphingorhabdus halotolerans TaxID=2725558 RepID=A0A6H2DJL5_9SPHN|nr:type II toxin-antitoxin system VapC family toxin [Parasphingorhabdus halotolerans]QJB68327.1 type II toxin-antitoxin system VapC family toxin [Parasphingorhabdus halotolerans]